MTRISRICTDKEQRKKGVRVAREDEGKALRGGIVDRNEAGLQCGEYPDLFAEKGCGAFRLAW